MLKEIYRFLHPRFRTLFLEYRVAFKPRYGHGRPPHRELYEIIQANRAEYVENLRAMLSFKENLQTIKPMAQENNPDNPGWNNGFLPGLDIAGIYTMLAKYRPARYVEVGSGNSTKVAFKAKKEQNLPTEIISIDPFPRAEIDHLANSIIRQPFENVDFAPFLAEFKAGDILFIDNSHRILPNSDAMVFFLEVLPRLPLGVLVHIHDIYLPYDYPQFMCDRFYSEQYGLAMFLLANPKRYKTILPNYFISEDETLSDMVKPLWEHPNLKDVERHGGSYWIEIG
ncbi:MAG: class I SAM-dependent methyltransferase [Saprospiraceae bacterium]|nr:class I SAM-dependent methyltransferase [Saprospiraceae bacterium]